ncbi:hypothetical protein DDT91_19080 [Algoriphagus sp. AK58]|nr:hypothetical protein [Algoriphagus sp. AK58]
MSTSRPKSRLLPVLYFVKRQVSKVKLLALLKTGLVKKVMIKPYAGYGNGKEIYLAGRVLEDKGIAPSTALDSFWSNLGKMRKRFLTVVFPGVYVSATFENQKITVQTDEEGYFEIRLPIPNREFQEGWKSIELSMKNPVSGGMSLITSFGKVYFPSSKAEFGVISDIDDTIVSTGAMRMWEMIKVTFSQNAHTRIPFPGVSEFYHSLRKGSDGILSNPLFYVSSSPWNLYDFLMEFLEAHQIPKGPLMLRDLGLSRDKWIAGSHRDHKLKQIEHIFEVYPDLPFILIGDSGQQDPEIYLEALQRHTHKILAVYIRDISKRDLSSLKQSYTRMNVPLILVEDTLEAARHAMKQGWITQQSEEKIKAQSVLDQKG